MRNARMSVRVVCFTGKVFISQQQPETQTQ